MPYRAALQSLIARLEELRKENLRIAQEHAELLGQIEELLAQNQQAREWAEAEQERFRKERPK